MEDVFDKLQAITGISKYSGSEVITPQNIVKDMVDLLPPEIFKPDAKFLDPAVKSGRFLAEIDRRLFDSPLLADRFPNEADRRQHILENQLYGLATSATAATIVRKQLYDDPTIAGNIVYIDRYLTLMANKETDFRKLIEKEFGQMKFDVVIGNPPYQHNDGSGGKGGAGAIYDKFILKGISIASKVVMITPSRWFTGGRGLGQFRDKWLNDIHIKNIRHFSNSGEVFDGVRIAGGVSYFLWDNTHKNTDIGVEFRMDDTTEMRKLNEHDVFIVDSLSNNITRKVKQQKGMPLSQILKDKYYYGIDELGFSIDGDLHLFNSEGVTKNIIKSSDLKNPSIGFKCVTSSMTPDAVTKPYAVLNPIYILDENTVSASGYIVFDGLSSEQAVPLKKYLSSKLVRLLILNRRIGVNANRDAYSFVPVPDLRNYQDQVGQYKVDWSKSVADIDKQLYEKYGLSQEEIEYIENTIKPME